MNCINMVIFLGERNNGWKTTADGSTRIFHLCGNTSRRVNKDLSFIIVWIIRNRGYLLAGKSIWRGRDNWWSQDIDFSMVWNPSGSVSCVAWFRGTLFWSAPSVRVVYLEVDNKICYIWSPGCLMSDTLTSPSARNNTNPLHEAIHYASELISRGNCARVGQGWDIFPVGETAARCCG